jgi:hypothetical protein
MMADSRKIVRVFLASPGDLKEERQAAKAAVDEFNKVWAETSGYHVELIGWEDTVSQFGRPQGLINQDLVRCELFIGMLWKRWGTLPSVGGPFTSGFEEEYEISLRGRETLGRPELSLFFKKVPAESLDDPGNELDKVLKFRNKIIAEKKILFEEFKDPHQLEARIRGRIASYVQRLQADEAARLANESQSQPAATTTSLASLSSKHETVLSTEGATFLRAFLEKTEKEDDPNITNVEIARFRLLANLVTRSGNDEGVLGVHDANLLFEQRKALEFGRNEKVGLFECGLHYLNSENAPLWCWFEALEGFANPFLHIFTRYGTIEERTGAIDAMRLIGQSIDDLSESRNVYIQSWLGKETAPQIKLSALRYLGEYGSVEDLSVIKDEIQLANYRTRSGAVEAFVRICLRVSRESALERLIELAPESIGPVLVEQLFDRDEAISTDTLKRGISQPNNLLRLAVVKSLRSRNALDQREAETLLADSDARIRFEALQQLAESGRNFPDAEAILVKPIALGILSLGIPTDNDGEQCHKEWTDSRFKRMPLEELRRNIDSQFLLSPDAYFSLQRREFSKKKTLLRKSIDERFSSEFAAFLADFGRHVGPESEHYRKAIRLKDTLCKEMTRRGLDILCERSRPEDLNRVRLVLRDGYVAPSESDIDYLGIHGEWQDISLIVATLEQMGGKIGMLSSASDQQFAAGAKAICSIAGGRIGDVFAGIQMPRQLLRAIVAHMSDSQVKKLKTGAIEQLLTDEEESVRKLACLRILKSLPKSKLRQVLARHLGRNEQRYYNVVYWLDFGTSSPKEISTRGAAALLAEVGR